MIATALNLLKDHRIVMYHNDISSTVGPTGEIYCLPVYVINLPTKFECLKDTCEQDVFQTHKNTADQDLETMAKPQTLEVRFSPPINPH